ncbi:MAG: ABC transporter substrate-binding protein, partial [Pseudolabrys sp.]
RFLTGDDPVRLGFVKSLQHPSGNATGVYVFTSNLGPKRLGLVRDLFEKPGLIEHRAFATSASAPAQAAG